jgi:hypothetical protein
MSLPYWKPTACLLALTAGGLFIWSDSKAAGPDKPAPDAKPTPPVSLPSPPPSFPPAAPPTGLPMPPLPESKPMPPSGPVVPELPKPPEPMKVEAPKPVEAPKTAVPPKPAGDLAMPPLPSSPAVPCPPCPSTPPPPMASSGTMPALPPAPAVKLADPVMPPKPAPAMGPTMIAVPATIPTTPAPMAPVVPVVAEAPATAPPATAAPAPMAVGPAPRYKLCVRMGHGQPRFEVSDGELVVLKGTCERVEMPAPREGLAQSMTNLQALGNVRVSGPGLDGRCDQLVILSLKGEVLLKGNVQLHTHKGKSSSELNADQVIYQLSGSTASNGAKPQSGITPVSGTR